MNHLPNTSWDTNSVTLSGIDGNSFQFQQVFDNEAPDDARLSANQSSASTLTFEINFSDLINHQAELFYTILGGYYPTDAQKHKPMSHLYLSGHYAKDIVRVKPVYPEPADGDLASKYLTYKRARLTVSYETLPYYVELSSGGGLNSNWLSIGHRATNQRISTPLGWYEFASGTYAHFPAQFGTFFNQGIIYIQLTVHRTPIENILGGSSLSNCLPVTAVRDSLGLINSDTFMGAAPMTLLLDSVEYMPYGNILGSGKTYDCVFNIIYNSQKWNTSLDPGGSFTPIQVVATSVSPFNTVSFTNMLNIINP